MTKKTHLAALGLSLTLLAVNGCALLHPSSDEIDDPVARAALSLREPAARGPASVDDDSVNGVKKERSAPSFNRLTLGMEMPQVVELWGKPSEVQAAGDPKEGNQRWSYSEGVAGLYGLGDNRVVYFEQGRVAGWESH